MAAPAMATPGTEWIRILVREAVADMRQDLSEDQQDRLVARMLADAAACSAAELPSEAYLP